jgi:hypothetical protein
MQHKITPPSKPKIKAVFFYGRQGTLVKLRPSKHRLVTGFLKQREREIIRRYSKHIADEFTTAFPEYTLPSSDFDRVKKELETTDEKVIIFLNDMFHPIVRIQNETTLAHVQDK